MGWVPALRTDFTLALWFSWGERTTLYEVVFCFVFFPKFNEMQHIHFNGKREGLLPRQNVWRCDLRQNMNASFVPERPWQIFLAKMEKGQPKLPLSAHVVHIRPEPKCNVWCAEMSRQNERRRRHFGLTTGDQWGIFRQSVPPNYRKWHQRTLLLSDDLIRRKWSWSRQLIHRRKKLKRGGRGWQNLIDFRVLDTFVLRIQTATSYETLSREGDGAVVTGKRHYEPCSRCCFLSRFAWLRCRLPTVSIAGSLWGWSIGFFSFASVFLIPCVFFSLLVIPPHAGRQCEPGAVC